MVITEREPLLLLPKLEMITQIDNLRRKILYQARSLTTVETLYPSDWKLSIAKPRSSESHQAFDIVNFSYNERYVDDHGQTIGIAPDRLDSSPQTKTLVLTQETLAGSVVLGTFRTVTGDEKLEIFELFTLKPGFRWPHEPTSNTPALKYAELGRFAINPVLDEIKRNHPDTKKQVDLLKRQILRNLWPLGMDILNKEEVDIPYFVLAPRVYQFVSSAGILPQRIEGEVPNTSEASINTRRRFSKYWKPDSPLEEQPAIYLAPWKISS